MKYLLVLAIVLIAYVLWRNSRANRALDREEERAKRPPVPPAGKPQEMVRCAVCAVHLPRADALPGADGLLYCSQEHRLRAGD